MTPFNLFYSWQSDLPADSNLRAISGCIKLAISGVETDLENIKLSYDEATRDVPGSPDIPVTILRKIGRSDIFVCDISIINSAESSGRKTPNPNVLFELGFAVSLLGWERIILVFNENFGDFRVDLPFDLEKRRVIAYKIADKKDKGGKSDLTRKLEVGIRSIIEKKPTKPSESSLKSPDEIKRMKDTSFIKGVMGVIHIETIDYFIECLPDKVVERIFFFWHSFKSICDSTRFHLYDTKLASLVSNFGILWGKTLQHWDMYSRAGIEGFYNFHKPADKLQAEEVKRIYQEVGENAHNLKLSFKDLVKYLRENYVEIDLDELSNSARDAYVVHEKEILDLLG